MFHRPRKSSYGFVSNQSLPGTPRLSILASWRPFQPCIELAKKAITDGANVNAKKEDGQTPLHFAVVAALDSGDNKVIELLIANGADVNAEIGSGRHQGMTPLDITGGLSEAATLTKRLRELQGKTDDIPVADLLRKHGGKTSGELKAEGK